MRRTTTLLGLVGVFLVGAGGSVAQAQTGAEVTFTDHIRPIFERSCWNCHGEASQLSELDLRTREAAVEGGARGPALVPGPAPTRAGSTGCWPASTTRRCPWPATP